MTTNKQKLTACQLFLGMTLDEIEQIIERTIVEKRQYEKGAIIAEQGRDIDYLYLLVEGTITTEMLTADGNIINIDIRDAVLPLAIAFIYEAVPRFPVAVIAIKPSEIYLLAKDKFLQEMTNNNVLFKNYLRMSAGITSFLSAKVAMMSTRSLKSKVALYILDNTTSENPSFVPKHNQTQLAEHLGVQRPSLARTLGQLVNEGAIATSGHKITVVDRKKLEVIV